MSQPNITNEAGVILTVGITAQSNRCALVFPVGTDAGILSDIITCSLALKAFRTNVLPALCDCFGSEGDVRFINAEGMKDGMIPYREDYDPATFTGTRGGGGLPASCGLLISFYEDPADVVAGHRMRVGHNTIPAQAPDDWPDGYAVGALVDAGNTLANLLVGGWAFDPAVGSEKWYRYLAAPARTAGTSVRRIVGGTTRGYVGTQRRRLIPH